MNNSGKGKILIAVLVAAVIVVASLSIVYLSQRKNTGVIVPELAPYYKGRIDIQFLNPNGTDASNVLSSIYFTLPNLGNVPENGSSFVKLIVRNFSQAGGVFNIPLNGQILTASKDWVSSFEKTNPAYSGGISVSFVVTGTERLANNSEYTVITHLSYSPLFIANNIQSSFVLHYKVKLDTWVSNSMLGASASAPSLANLPVQNGIPNQCTPGYYWDIELNRTYVSNNTWFPISWVSNNSAHGGGSIAATLGYYNEVTAFGVGAYNSFKGGWTSNVSQAFSMNGYVGTDTVPFSNFKSAAISINTTVELQTYQWVYQSSNCALTYYNDYEFDFTVDPPQTSGHTILMNVTYGNGNIPSILPKWEGGVSNYVYQFQKQYLNFTGTIQNMGSASVSYDVLKVSTQSTADKIIDLLPSGAFAISGINFLAKTKPYYQTMATFLADNLPYVGMALSAVQWYNVQIYTSVATVVNPSYAQTYDVYTFQTLHSFNLSGWGSGTDELLLDYYNVT